MPESRSADNPAIVVYESCVRPSQMRRHRSTSPSLPDSLAENKSPRDSAVEELIQAIQPSPSAKSDNDQSEAASSGCLATPALTSVIPLTFVDAEATSMDENATEADETSQKSEAADLQVALISPTRRSVAVQTDNELTMALSPLSSPHPHLELPFCPLSLSPRPLSLSPRHLSLSPRPLSISPRPLSLSPRPLSLSPRCLQSCQPLQLRRVARMSRRRQRRLRKSLRQRRQKLANQSTSETDETAAMPRLNWAGQAASSDSEGISVSQAADMATYGLLGLMWLLLLQWVLMAAIDAFSAPDSNFRERTADWE